MGAISSIWIDYSAFINQIKIILPEFESHRNHIINKHILDGKTIDELLEIRSKLLQIEVSVKGFKIRGLSPIHKTLSLMAKEERFELTEFQEIYDVLEVCLDESIIKLNNVSAGLMIMAEDISKKKISDIKHKFFKTLPDNHKDYDKEIELGFLDDFKNKLLPKLLSHKWTIKEYNDYISLRYADKIVNELYS
jgi:hypothetical protein